MKLPRFRLGTVIKAVVVVNLAAAMVWANLIWGELPEAEANELFIALAGRLLIAGENASKGRRI